MANVTQLKHLEHIEDEMLNYGVQGCDAAVSAMQELLRMLGKDGTSSCRQSGWRTFRCLYGSLAKIFFVGTKSVFAKTEPKLCFMMLMWTVVNGDLAVKLKACLKYFPALKIDGVVQGDLLFTDSDKKKEYVDGEHLITFRPNTITYGIPTDHPIGQQVDRAHIGIVFHTHYVGDDLPTMRAQAGAKVSNHNDAPDVAVIENDTPYHDISVSPADIARFENTSAKWKGCVLFVENS